MDKFGVEDTVFYEVGITTFYNCTRSLLQTAKFAHMNGHWELGGLQFICVPCIMGFPRLGISLGVSDISVIS